MRMLKFVGLAVLLGVLAGCGTTPEDESSNGAADAADRAIAEATAAVERAEEMDAEWRDSREILDDAIAAREAEDYEEAERLANEALYQAEQAIEQHEKAMADASEEKGAADSEDSETYEVGRGDNLWNIAGKATTYDNPYQWPLIFRANRDQIEDADLIFPGQEFEIRHDHSSSEIEAAEKHARTRGEWALGRVEESDRRYLER
ncbi:MAG: LysM peptidoglycan-binding domain-containing protein [Thiohalospira sp.]